MSNEEPMSAARAGVALTGEIIKAAGENPQVKEAGTNLGQTAITLTHTINTVLSLSPTKLGEQFAKAVGIAVIPTPPSNG